MATKIANLNGVPYVIDFSQKTFWTVESQTLLRFLKDDAGLPTLPDGSTAILNGFRRIT